MMLWSYVARNSVEEAGGRRHCEAVWAAIGGWTKH